MATCAVDGPGAGTAAALCARSQLSPRAALRGQGPAQAELQQTLLRDDQTIKGVKNEDPADLAPQAKAKASAEHEGASADHVVNGWVRDEPGRFDNKWAAPLGRDGAWIELAWDEAQAMSRIQITFDSGFHRELTLSSSDEITKGIIRARSRRRCVITPCRTAGRATTSGRSWSRWRATTGGCVGMSSSR